MKWLLFSSLRFRLILLVLIAVIPALVITTYSGLELHEHARLDAFNKALDIAKQISTNHQQLIENARQIFFTLSQIPQLRERNAKESSKIFSDLFKETRGYTSFNAILPNGDVFASSQPLSKPVNLADRPWFKRVIKTKSFVIGEYVIGRISGKPTIVIAHPVLDGMGDLIAVLTAGLDLEWIHPLLAESNLPEGSSLNVVDFNGTILFRYPEPEKFVGKSMPEASILKAILSKREGTEETVGLDGVPRLFGFTSLGKGVESVHVCAGIPKKVVFAEVNRVMARNLIFLGFIGILAFGTAWFIGGVFVFQPVNRLLKVTKRLAQGDLTVRSELSNKHGEIGQLAHSFDQMAESLEQREAERRRAELRIRHLNRLYATLSQVNQTIVRVKDRDELFRSICKVAVDYGKFGLAWVGLIDHEAESVTPVAINGIAHERFPFQAIHYKEMLFKEGLVGKAVESDGVVYSRDIQSDPAMRDWSEMAIAGGYHAAAAVPFRLNSDIAGLLNLYATDADFFEDEELRDLLKEMALDISFALNTIALEEKRRLTEEELRLLQTIAFAMSEAEDLHSALKIVLQKVCEATGWLMGEAWVPNSDGTSLECSPAWYGKVEGLEKFRKECEEMTFSPGIGLPGRVWVSKKPEWIKDVTSDPNFLRAKMAKEAGIHTAIAIPVLIGEEIIAVMNFFEFELRKEDERFLETISSVATQLGSLIQRKHAEEARAKAEAQLIQAQKMESIGTLAGGVAHDFNNMLTTIQGYAQLGLMTMKEGEPLYDNLKEIMQASQRAANLTRQLLLFSRKQPMDLLSLSMNETVDNLKKMLKRLIGEDIAIDTSLEPNLWMVQTDPGNMEQVIMNLVVNARDAMPGGGKITIKTENVDIDKSYCEIYSYARPGKFVCLSVEDKGIGMDQETLRQIFEPFFTTKGLGKGTGLGLSVVYGIVKQAEGWINVYSEPGKGSVFRVYLPAASGEAKEEAKKELISTQDFHGKGERILLVEDDEGIRGFAEKILADRGYVKFVASNAEEAWRIFKKEGEQFDLVFSDVVLPDRSGIELVEELLSAKPDLKVLLTSGYTDQKSQWPLIKEKGYRFLQKPYNVADLLRVMREVIEKK